MSKLQFCLIITEEQRECCNSYLHTEQDYGWLVDTTVYFNNIREYTFVTEHVIYGLRESGWEMHLWDLSRTPDPLTLDLTGIPNVRHIPPSNEKEEAEKDEEESL